MAVLNIPIAKAGKGVTFSVDMETVNELLAEDAIFKQVVEEGLKTILNSRMSKLSAPSKLEGKELESAKAAALAKAQENLADLRAGKLTKKTGGATKGVAGKVMTEARRLARDIIKNEIRKAGMKPSQVEAKDITAAANALIEQDPSLIEEAKANIEERETKPLAIDIKSLVKESPKLQAKAKAKAEQAKANKPLSAKQAGKVAPRKPSAAVQSAVH